MTLYDLPATFPAYRRATDMTRSELIEELRKFLYEYDSLTEFESTEEELSYRDDAIYLLRLTLNVLQEVSTPDPNDSPLSDVI